MGKYEHTKVYKVRFDGWPTKYDEVCIISLRTTNLTASNLNPFALLLLDIPASNKILPSESGNLSKRSTRKYHPFPNLETRKNIVIFCSTNKV